MTELSVVIATFNRANDLRRCLDAIAAQTASSERFEVVVVDDGSIDGTPQMLAGQRMEPLVSVPTETVTRLAATATAEPELEPHGERSSAYGLRHCPPRALQPLDE